MNQPDKKPPISRNLFEIAEEMKNKGVDPADIYDFAAAEDYFDQVAHGLIKPDPEVTEINRQRLRKAGFDPDQIDWEASDKNTLVFK